ncbi:MAG: hypothetical protein WBB57_05170 [Mycobacterium sp.]
MIVRGYRMTAYGGSADRHGARHGRSAGPPRGGIRQLPPLVIFAAVAVGWFLPLFGLTLAAFVAVDLIINAAKARRSTTRKAETDV